MISNAKCQFGITYRHQFIEGEERQTTIHTQAYWQIYITSILFQVPWHHCFALEYARITLRCP